jgi:hypothetical protein
LHSRLVIALVAATLISACGDGGDDSPGTITPPTSCTPSSGNAAVGSPTVLNVRGDVSGVDINVAGPSACPALNAELLGVADLGASEIFAGANGDVIRRGETKHVVLFGPGLSGSLQISVSGPNDVTVANARNIQARDGTPGVLFDIVIGPSAALGARTVILRNSGHDITTFTGGLEVLP